MASIGGDLSEAVGGQNITCRTHLHHRDLERFKQLCDAAADDCSMTNNGTRALHNRGVGAEMRGAALGGGDRGGLGDQGGGSDDYTTGQIIAGAIEVHRHLGPGLLESAYEQCLCYELSLRGLRFVRQSPVPLLYKGVRLDCGYRADLVVESRVLVELKTVEQLMPLHVAQTSTYLRLADLDVALLMNFNVISLRRGIRRLERPPP